MIRKHAYLIKARHNFNQLKILLKLLDDVRNDIYIHIDKSAGPVSFDDIKHACSKSHVFFVKRITESWGVLINCC